MALVKRLVKGAPLTNLEGDENLEYLEGLGLSASANSLSDVLSNGNITGGLDIALSDGDKIVPVNGSASLNLRDGGDNIISLSTGEAAGVAGVYTFDFINGVEIGGSDRDWSIYGTKGRISQISDAITPDQILIEHDDIVTIDTTSLNINSDVVIGTSSTISSASGNSQLDLWDGEDGAVKLTGDTIHFDGDVNPIDITLNDLQSATDLKIGSTYRITDSSQGDVYVKAIDNENISNEVIKKFFVVPDDYYTSTATDAQGVFDANDPVNVTAGQFWIWGGRLWECTTSGTGIEPDNDYTLPAANFTKLDTSDDKYEIKYMKSIYDLDRDWISKTWDWKGNVIGDNWPDPNYNSDIVDWGNEFIYNNNINGYIFNNSNDGYIEYNRLEGYIFNNSNNGSIDRNSNDGSINRNSNDGSINRNSNSGNINSNTNSGNINSNSNNGSINRNSNSGSISRNSNSSFINNNSNSSTIINNSNNGSISNNSNNGGIINNSNNGSIQSNSNGGGINSNTNSGSIRNNTSDGGTTFTIRNNQNNGEIRYNNSTANISIEYNINNGRIGPSGFTHTDRSVDITDTIVNK